ncbi:hypothetical protein [Bradyrhizobium iriomotense]|uniref:Uncharacterized protein n=1 Tax=Bradyrhizobium iriomotense TaxID=441950 RepID=A0ABQ6AXQ3_9BRAD|nr:hypothetical protein [Bradyrhizobium iriomotense]GLR86908.1 hypothetical protein GCM10007857_36190 [Bradyrhizobium iriomotense]
MKNLLLVVTAIAAIGGVATNHAGACALRFPTFELTGFPISRHQVAVLGSAQVEESTVTPALMSDSMPASPHQIAVLTPRVKKLKIAEASVDPGLLTVGQTRSGSRRSTGQAMCAAE